MNYKSLSVFRLVGFTDAPVGNRRVSELLERPEEKGTFWLVPLLQAFLGTHPEFQPLPTWQPVLLLSYTHYRFLSL